MSVEIKKLLGISLSALWVGAQVPSAFAQQNCNEAQADAGQSDSYVCADSDSGDQAIFQNNVPPFVNDAQRAFAGAIIGGDSLTLTNNAQLSNTNPLAPDAYARGGIYVLDALNFSFVNNGAIDVPGLIGVLVENSSGTINLAANSSIDAGTGVSVAGSSSLTVNNDSALNATGVGMLFSEVAALTLNNTNGAIVSSGDAAIDVSSAFDSSVNTVALISNEANITGADDAIRVTDVGRFTLSNESGATIEASAGAAVNVSTTAGASRDTVVDISNAASMSGDSAAISLNNIPTAGIANLAGGTIDAGNGFAIDAIVSDAEVAANVVIGNAETGTITGSAGAIQLDNVTTAFVNNAGSITATADAAVVAGVSGQNAPLASLTVNNEATGTISADLNAVRATGLDSLTINNAGTLDGLAGAAISASVTTADINNTAGSLGSAEGLAIVADAVSIDNADGANIASSVIDLNIGASSAEVTNAGTMSALVITGLLDVNAPAKASLASVANSATGQFSESVQLLDLLTGSVANSGSMSADVSGPAIRFADNTQSLLSNAAGGGISSAGIAVDVDGGQLFSASNRGDITSTNGRAIDVLDSTQTVLINDGEIRSDSVEAIFIKDTLAVGESASATAQLTNNGLIRGSGPALQAEGLATLELTNNSTVNASDSYAVNANVDALLLTNTGELQTASTTTGDIQGLLALVSDLTAVNDADASMGISMLTIRGDSDTAASFSNAGELAVLEMVGQSDSAKVSVNNSGRIAGQVVVDDVLVDASASGDIAEALVLQNLESATVENSGEIVAEIEGDNTNDEGLALRLTDIEAVVFENTVDGSVVGSRNAISLRGVETATISNEGMLSVADMSTSSAGAAIDALGNTDTQSGDLLSAVSISNDGVIDGKAFLALDLNLMASVIINNSGQLLREGGFVAQVSNSERVTLENAGQMVSTSTDTDSRRYGFTLAAEQMILSNTEDGVIGESELVLLDSAAGLSTVTNAGRLAKLAVTSEANQAASTASAGSVLINNSGTMDLRVGDEEGDDSGSAQNALEISGLDNATVLNSGSIAIEGTARGTSGPDASLFDGVALSATIGEFFSLTNEIAGTIEGASAAALVSGFGDVTIVNDGAISANGNDDSVAIDLEGDRTRTRMVSGAQESFASVEITNSGSVQGADRALDISNWQSVTVTNTGSLNSDRGNAVAVNADNFNLTNNGLILGDVADGAGDSPLRALEVFATESIDINNQANGSIAAMDLILDPFGFGGPGGPAGGAVPLFEVENAGEIAAINVENSGGSFMPAKLELSNSGEIAGNANGASAGQVGDAIAINGFDTVTVENAGTISASGAPQSFPTPTEPDRTRLIGRGTQINDVFFLTVNNLETGTVFGRNYGLKLTDVGSANVNNSGLIRANNVAIDMSNGKSQAVTEVLNTGIIEVLGGIDLSNDLPALRNAAIVADDSTKLSVEHTGGAIFGNLFAGNGTDDSLLIRDAGMAQARAGATSQQIDGFETLQLDGAVEFLSATTITNAGNPNALQVTQTGKTTIHESLSVSGSYELTSTANLVFRIDEQTPQLSSASLLTVDSFSGDADASYTISVNDADYLIEEGEQRRYQLIELTSGSGITDNQVLVDSVLVQLDAGSIDANGGLALTLVPITIEDYLSSGATQAEARVGIAAREALFGNPNVDDNDPVKLRMQEANREGFGSLIDFFESLLTDTSGRSVNTAGASLFAAQNNIRGRSAGLAGGISSGSAMAESGWWISALNIDFEQSEKDGHEGFEGDGDGFTLGIDHWFNRDLNVGIAASVLNSNTESESGNDSLETDGNLVSLYTTGRLMNGFLLHTQITSATYDNESVRDVAGTKAEASYEADQMAISVLLSRPITSGNWQWTPSASLSWSELDISAYQESGSSAALAVDGQTYNENLLGLGMALSYVHQSRNGNWFLPRLRVDVMHDAAGDDVEVTSRFLVGGQRFVTPGVEHEAMRVSASTGFQWLIGNYSSVDFDLNYYQSGDYESTSVEAKLRYEF